MLKLRQDGFTLVELTIVIAISASLAVIVLTSQSSVRDTAQFRGVVNSLASSLNEVRANAAASIVTTSTGTHQSTAIFGELVQARPGDGYLTVSDLTAPLDVSTNAISGSLTVLNSRSIMLPFGVTVKSIISPSTSITTLGTTYTLVYRRLLSSGKLVLYAVGAADYHNVLNYTESPSATLAPGMYPVEATVITIMDPAGRFGSVTVDGRHDAATTTQVIIQ